MALVRALMIFVLLWGVCAVGLHVLLSSTGRPRWHLGRLALVSAAGAALAGGLLWAIVALF